MLLVDLPLHLFGTYSVLSIVAKAPPWYCNDRTSRISPPQDWMEGSFRGPGGPQLRGGGGQQRPGLA